MNTILVLCPHPDDAEFSCGATIARYIEEGKNVHYAVFSPCTQSVPQGFDPDVLYRELATAAGVLGVKTTNITYFNYPVREFPSKRQEILEDLIQLKKTINPNLVLCPNSTDVHQDHQVIHQECIRAFKDVNILGYELPWNNLSVTTNYFVKITQQHLSKKINAIKEYKSQGFRPYAGEEFFKGLAAIRGIQAKTTLAEAFEFVRWVS